MVEVRYLEIDSHDEGQRLDNYLIKVLKGVPKSHIYRIIRGGEVRINKKRVKPETRLHVGDSLRIPPVRVSPEKSIFVGDRLASQLHASIIYEDNELLVINKPAGIAVHGGSGLSLGIIESLRKLRTDLRYLELVHRLDKETSGCLLLAKKRSALRAIHGLFESRAIEKTYWALLLNPWEDKQTLKVNVPLEKNTLRSGERIVRVDEEGKSSESIFHLLENFNRACFVEVKPKTGRTHQIRVHSAYLGHPVLGDDKYGGDIAKDINISKRLYLHARKVQFTLNGHSYQFEADIDQTFVKTLTYFKSTGTNLTT